MHDRTDASRPACNALTCGHVTITGRAPVLVASRSATPRAHTVPVTVKLEVVLRMMVMLSYWNFKEVLPTLAGGPQTAQHNPYAYMYWHVCVRMCATCKLCQPMPCESAAWPMRDGTCVHTLTFDVADVIVGPIQLKPSPHSVRPFIRPKCD